MFIHVSLHASRCVPRVHTNEIINEHTQRRLPYEIGRDVHKIIEGCKLQILVVMHKHLSSFAIWKDGQYFKAHLQSVPKGCASRNK